MLLQKRDCSERFPNRTYREQGIRGQRYFGCEICITEDSGPERLCSVSKGQCHARDLVGNHVLANCSPQLTADWVDLKHISRSPSGTGRKARHTNAATLQECPASRQLTSTNWCRSPLSQVDTTCRLRPSAANRGRPLPLRASWRARSRHGPGPTKCSRGTVANALMTGLEMTLAVKRNSSAN